MGSVICPVVEYLGISVVPASNFVIVRAEHDGSDVPSSGQHFRQLVLPKAREDSQRLEGRAFFNKR